MVFFVCGVNVPASPTGKFGIPDITLPYSTNNPVSVSVTATNIPPGTQVTLMSVPEYGASSNSIGTLSGTEVSSATSISLTLSTTYQSILTAKVIYTVQTAMYYDGEKVEKVRVASTMGGESQAVYITEKGREIPAEMLLARMME
jgi:hypothetical protein